MEGERDAGMLVGLARGKWRGVLEGTATWCGEDGERVCIVSVDSAGKMVVSVGDR